jgi:hypothetical protein
LVDRDPILASRSSSRLANFFFATFFFLAKKKVDRSSLLQRDEFLKNSVTVKKYLFFPITIPAGAVLF